MTGDRDVFIESGIRNLDTVLGGGIRSRDVLLISGPPGSGKTTFVFQTAFHHATAGRKTVYLSTLSEPGSRLIRHLRTYSFADEAQLGKHIFLESVYPLIKEGLAAVIDSSVATMRAHGASLLILDGLMTLRDLDPDHSFSTFVHDLSVALAPNDCTVLVTSTGPTDLRTQSSSSEFTMCDGVVELTQREDAVGAKRLLRAWKTRGAQSLLGYHAMDITREGLTVFPSLELLPIKTIAERGHSRHAFGVPALDERMSGGLPSGTVSLLSGPAGTGKTLLALQFLAQGIRHRQLGLMVSFHESPAQLIAKAEALAVDLGGENAISCWRPAPIGMGVDQWVSQLWERLHAGPIRRLVIDGLPAIERAIRDDRRALFLTALGEQLRARGVTTLVITDANESVPGLFDMLADNVIVSSYAENAQRSFAVTRMRNTAHDTIAQHFPLSAEAPAK